MVILKSLRPTGIAMGGFLWSAASITSFGAPQCPTTNQVVTRTVSWQATPSPTTLTSQRFELCPGSKELLNVTLPANSWLTTELQIRGTGKGLTDLDLGAVNTSRQITWTSAFDSPIEQLAWFNDSATPVVKTVVVYGKKNLNASTYHLVVRKSNFDKSGTCESHYGPSPSAAKHPCNQILMFPQTLGAGSGYYVSHSTHWSFLRREVIYLVRDAARLTAAAFPGTNPLALMDMSERDGSTPGTSSQNLRHPRGTHINGNDLDIAYYQTDGTNNGQVVCQHDTFFCTAKPQVLDAPRTAFFMAQLLRSPYTRVIGVDPKIFEELLPAASKLIADGRLLPEDLERFKTKVAYGKGWPFHHHHLHFSWKWETHSSLENASKLRNALAPGIQNDPYPNLSIENY